MLPLTQAPVHKHETNQRLLRNSCSISCMHTSITASTLLQSRAAEVCHLVCMYLHVPVQLQHDTS
jgi:hypothetical protein